MPALYPLCAFSTGSVPALYPPCACPHPALCSPCTRPAPSFCSRIPRRCLVSFHSQATAVERLNQTRLDRADFDFGAACRDVALRLDRDTVHLACPALLPPPCPASFSSRPLTPMRPAALVAQTPDADSSWNSFTFCWDLWQHIFSQAGRIGV